MGAVPRAFKQLQLDLNQQLIVDLFAGGGGVSVGMEMAWGRSPDIAVNHNEHALSLHQRNHPQTQHFIADVYEVDPLEATAGKPVGWLHLSPDCTHHSQASAGQPRDAKVRGLSWVGYRWAAQVRPICISLENVRPILSWGGLIAKRDPATGRVLKRVKVQVKTARGQSFRTEWHVAEPGETVRVQDQYLTPDPKKAGKSWQKFVSKLEALGYVVEHRLIRAADRGGHTTRERLIMMARCDGQPIIWPEATYSRKGDKGKRWKPAHECMDFSHPCLSIFKRKKDLAINTHKRIAKGIEKFVLQAETPFIVPNNTTVNDAAAISAPILAKFRGDSVGHALTEPVPTITAGGKMARDAGAAHALGIIAPVLIQAGHGEGKPGGVKRWGVGAKDIRDSIGTVTASGGGQALAAAYLMQANDGFNTTFGRGMQEPITSITASGSQQQLVTASLSKAEAQEGLDISMLAPETVQNAMTVFAMMMKHAEGERWEAARKRESISTREALSMISVRVNGVIHLIVDIGLRMLKPRELYNAQDFPADYIIDEGHDGRKFTVTQQVRMVGNSVDPLMVRDIFRLNAPGLAIRKAA